MAVGRSRLARVIGPILIFLGALLITAAIAGPAYVADKLKTIPLDIDVTTVAKSTKPTDSRADEQFPARALDLCSINRAKAVVNDTQVTTQTRTVVTSPSDESSMTVQSGLSMVNSAIKTNGEPKRPELSNANQGERPCGDGLISAWVDRVSLDRETAQPNGKTSETVFTPGESAPATKIDDRKGLQYRFPADTTKDDDYSYYDLVTRGNTPLKFVEEQEVSGTKTLHFQGQTEWVDLSTITKDPTLGTRLSMPASWWGIGGVDDDELITLNRWAQTSVDLWVDPVSGIIVDQSNRYVQQFRLPKLVAANTPRQVRDYSLEVFDAQQRWVEATVRSQADAAKSAQNKTSLAKFVAPVVGGVLGAIALILGIVALFLGRGGRGKPAAIASDNTDGPSGSSAATAPNDPIDEPATEAFTAASRPDDPQTQAFDPGQRGPRQ